MKLSKAKEYLPFVQAAADGKTIQRRSGAEWQDWSDSAHCAFDLDPECYRIKPEPKLRAWRSVSEVPMGALIREKGDTCNASLILGYSAVGIELLGDTPKIHTFTLEKLFDFKEYSIDGGPWLPCGVMEDSHD